MTNELQLCFRNYVHEKDFETLLDLQQRSIGAAVAELNGGIYPAADQRAFFEDDYRRIAPTIVSLISPAGTEKVVASFQLSTAEENDGKAVSLDAFYIDWNELGRDAGNKVGNAILKLALNKAHEEKLPLEIPPLITDKNALRFLQTNGFSVLVEDEPYPEGSIERKDFGWVRCAILQHDDTVDYAVTPGRPVIGVGNTGYEGRDNPEPA